MKKTLAFAILLLGLFASCKENKVTEIFTSDEEEKVDSAEVFAGDTLHLFDDEMPPETVDELFDDFFFNFASDQKFQGQRISFPLSCKDGSDEIKLSHQDWAHYNRFNTQDFYSVIYEREQDMELQKDTALSSVAVEWVYLREDYVEKFNFLRVNGKWVLSDIHKENFANLPNGEFLQFYSKFVADSTFQRNSLVQPLKLVLTAQSDEEEEQVEELTADQWFEMKAELPFAKDALVTIDYGQACISQNKKTLLMEGVSNGFYMKFRFDKSGDEWRLHEIEY
ncbi:MAG: DUF4348 domain-containing protein [Prevotellaceae bacterium]|nr:DUF4348 domain-containing protein [Candidatus Minthosoma caballi]